MQAKILTQELLGQGLLVPFPDQTKGTMPQIFLGSIYSPADKPAKVPQCHKNKTGIPGPLKT